MSVTEAQRKTVLENLYAQIKEHGWVVDNRSVRPTLIKGTFAKTFETHEAAIMFALTEIRKEK